MKWCHIADLLTEIVETTFVVSHFSDIRKETTSFLVLPKRNEQERRSYDYFPVTRWSTPYTLS